MIQWHAVNSGILGNGVGHCSDFRGDFPLIFLAIIFSPVRMASRSETGTANCFLSTSSLKFTDYKLAKQNKEKREWNQSTVVSFF